MKKIYIKLLFFGFIALVIVSFGIALSNKPKSKSLTEFKFLTKDMSYAEIVAKVGNPNDEIGSGLYIYSYTLDDGKTLLLSFADLDHLFDARIYNPKTSESHSIFIQTSPLPTPEITPIVE